MRKTTVVKIIRTLSVGLTVAAFLGSWKHGVEWSMDHLPEGQLAWAMFLASLPEIMVILGVLKLSLNRSDVVARVMAGSGVAWTLWANGASAEPGVSGMVVALWPAYCALLAVALNHSPSDPDQEPVVTQVAVTPVTRPKAKPVTRSTVTRDPVGPGHEKPALTRSMAQPVAASDPAPRVTEKVSAPAKPGQLDAVLAYLLTQDQLPTRSAIMAATGISESTVKRAIKIEKARRGETA